MGTESYCLKRCRQLETDIQKKLAETNSFRGMSALELASHEKFILDLAFVLNLRNLLGFHHVTTIIGFMTETE